jgi:hypothetical protein
MLGRTKQKKKNQDKSNNEKPNCTIYDLLIPVLYWYALHCCYSIDRKFNNKKKKGKKNK